MLNRYKLKKIYKTISSVGWSPKLWLFEWVARLLDPEVQQIRPSSQQLPAVERLDSQSMNDDVICQSLDQAGVVVIEELIDRELCQRAAIELQTVFDEIEQLQQVDEWGDKPNYRWQTDYAWSDNYLEVASLGKAVVNIRARRDGVDDAGMVDIFDIEALAASAGLNELQQLFSAVKDSGMSNLIAQYSGYQQRQSNLYYNREIAQTRGPHVDNNSDPYKLFVYLTDVKQRQDGPYCYLPGSHRQRHWMSFERLKNAINRQPSTEVSSVKKEEMQALLGPAGSVIISCQSGVHCGTPQALGHRRIALVCNFY